MGLLLSVFVVFVSVVELLTVCSDCRRRLEPIEYDKDLSPLIRRYEAGLFKERQRILKILDEYRKLEKANGGTVYPNQSINDKFYKSRSGSPLVPAVPRNSICSELVEKEDIESIYLNKDDLVFIKEGSKDEKVVDSNSHQNRKIANNTPKINGVVLDNGLAHAIPLYLNAVSTEEDVLNVASKCEIVKSDKKDLEPIRNLNIENKEFTNNDKCKDVIENTNSRLKVNEDLHSITFDNVDYWPSKVSIEKKKNKIKGNKKSMKFGLNAEELEPDWSRAPSPLLKLVDRSSSPVDWSRALDWKSLGITDLNQQIVTENYWERSPSPFRKFINSKCDQSCDINKEIVSEDEVTGEPIRHDFDSWNPNKKISDEEPEVSFNKPFYYTLDGLKAIKKSRKYIRKSTSQNNTDGESIGSSKSTTSNNNCKNESSKIIKQLERGSLDKQHGSASNAFWLIFSGEYTKAMNKDWHGQHFCCWQCDESLTGQRYVLREEHPYCVACYESVFANSCEKCGRTIGIDSKDLSYKDKHWHEACFLCATCGDSLVDKQFGSKGDRIYCGRCYDEQFASRCDGCGQIFRAGTKKMEYKTRQWHEKCFCCCVCKTPIGTQSFIPREQEIYCAKCYEEKYATRCIKCNKVITSGGVTYKNEPWHRECFTCTHCNTSLAGARFTSRDDKPYCAECFGELFAKRCTACNKPITGIGGTKFISFEDRHWHNDCFFCASCHTSLVGRGFITDGDDIICPECAKQKLM